MAAADIGISITVRQLPFSWTAPLRLKTGRHTTNACHQSDIGLLFSMNLTYPCFPICLASSCYTLPSHSPSPSSFVTFCSLPCFFCFQFSVVKCFMCEITCIILRVFKRTIEIYIPSLRVCVCVSLCACVYVITVYDHSNNNIASDQKKM